MRFTLFPILSAGLIACGGTERTSAPPPAVDQVIILAPDSVLIGQSIHLDVELRDAAGNLLTGRTITFESSNGSVAAVSPAGEVTLGDTGSAVITATSEGVSGQHGVTAWALRFGAIAVGRSDSCGLTRGGRVYCWGIMAGGATPVELADTRVYVAIDVGPTSACGLTAQGDAACWGDPALGATAVAGAPPLAHISIGRDFTCGIDFTGLGHCWGSNTGGRLGTGQTGDSPTPAPVAGGASYIAISSGAYHACAVLATGEGSCWGTNGNAQLGNPSVPGSTLTPVTVSGGLTLSRIGSGLLHTCAVATDSTGWCWGDNYSGVLGNNSVLYSPVPVAVAGGIKFSAIDPGELATCGLDVDGGAWCWGNNGLGVLGNGSTIASDDSVPVRVAGGVTFSQVSLGSGRHACGLSTAGEAWCWGANGNGQLGVPGTLPRYAPVRVMGQAVP